MTDNAIYLLSEKLDNHIMKEDAFQQKLLERLSEHSVMLASISVEIQNLKSDRSDTFEQNKELERRIREIESKLSLASVVGLVTTFVAAYVAYKMR